jgi:hypothetical protein
MRFYAGNDFDRFMMVNYTFSESEIVSYNGEIL